MMTCCVTTFELILSIFIAFNLLLIFIAHICMYNNMLTSTYLNLIGGVMVSVLASSEVVRGFEPRLGQTKDYTIGMCCLSDKHAA